MPAENRVNIQQFASQVQALLQQHGLTSKPFGIILHIPRQEFEALSRQNPGHHPRMILIKQGDDWFVQIQPVPEPGDYPTGKDLKPDSFQKAQKKPTPKTRSQKSR